MIKRLLILLSFLFLWCDIGFSQNKKIIDSLTFVYNNAKVDTIKANALRALGSVYLRQKPDTALTLLSNSMKISQKIGYTNGILEGKIAIGQLYRFQSKFDIALSYYEDAKKIAEQLKNKNMFARVLYAMANLYYLKNEYPQAMDFYQKSLKIAEETKNKSLISSNLNNIANVLKKEKQYTQALDYYKQGLKIGQELKDNEAISIAFNNIGNILIEEKKYTEALDYYKKSLEIKEKLKDESGMSATFNNIASIYTIQEKYDEALKYYQEAFKIKEKLKDKIGMTHALNGIAELYQKQKDYDKSIEYSERALKVAQEIKTPQRIGESAKTLSESYKLKGDYKKSLEYFELAKTIADSLFSLEKGKAISNLTSTMELERKQKELALVAKDNELNKINAEKKQRELEITKKQAEADQLLSLAKQEKDKRKADSLYNLSQQAQLQADKLKAENQTKNLEIQKQKEEKEFQQIITYLILVGFVCILIFSIFMVRSQQIQKTLNKALSKKTIELNEKNDELSVANEELHQQQEEIITQRDYIEQQNQELGIQNRKMNDSVRAALIIQKALLPFETRMNKFLSDYFILFLPKDVVSGDFYWVEEKNGKKIIIAADCTGHGVPGAFMSLIGMSLLDKIVMQQNITNPAEILTNLHEMVRYALKQEESDNQNGMDVAVVCLEGNKVTFAGAKRPFYYINSEKKDEVLFLDESRKSIGGIQNEEIQFVNQEIVLPKDSIFFIGSDGLLDQNNVARRKLKKVDLFNLLVNNFDKDMETQKNMIYELLKNHMGRAEQRDDILWLGIKI